MALGQRGAGPAAESLDRPDSLVRKVPLAGERVLDPRRESQDRRGRPWSEKTRQP